MIAPVISPQSPLQELVPGPVVTNRVVRPAADDDPATTATSTQRISGS